MRVLVCRHAHSNPAPPGTSDHLRSLSPEGVRTFRRLTDSLRGELRDLEITVASPYLRAQQTREILLDCAPNAEKQTDKRLIPGSSPAAFLELLSELKAFSSLAIISHEPSVSTFTSQILANGELDIAFEPGAIACLWLDSIRSVRARLLWFVNPLIV